MWCLFQHYIAKATLQSLFLWNVVFADSGSRVHLPHVDSHMPYSFVHFVRSFCMVFCVYFLCASLYVFLYLFSLCLSQQLTLLEGDVEPTAKVKATAAELQEQKQVHTFVCYDTNVIVL